ncbi:MAG TPA: hypothetical protein VFT75_08515 [Nocardioidaceae bacterium]|nr:hypothetical protein [Nocardioidaceae bacterium]
MLGEASPEHFAVVSAPLDLALGDHTVLQPDLMVFLGPSCSPRAHASTAVTVSTPYRLMLFAAALVR